MVIKGCGLSRYTPCNGGFQVTLHGAGATCVDRRLGAARQRPRRRGRFCPEREDFAHGFRAERRSNRNPGRRPRFRRRTACPAFGRVGREETLSRRRAARGRRAGFRRHLCERGCRGQRIVAPGRLDHLRGAQLRRRADGRLPDHPQHGLVDDRPVRLRRPAPALPAAPDDHGADRQLLPDRAGRGLGRGQACARAPSWTATTMS
jgi:hypothetical protein